MSSGPSQKSTSTAAPRVFSTGGFIEIGRRQKLVTVYVVRGELTKPRPEVNVFPDLLQGRPHGRAPRLRLGGVLSHVKKKKYQTG